MKTTCEQFANAVVTDEDIASFTEHVATCGRCQGLARTVAGLGAASGPGQLRATDAEPRMGFAARITVGAQHRVTQRRRNRYIMTGAGGLVAAAAVTALLVSQRNAGTPAQPAANVPSLEKPEPTQPEPVTDPAPVPHVLDEDRDNLRALVRWQATADAWQQDRLPSAVNWRKTIKPVAAYQTVLTLDK